MQTVSDSSPKNSAKSRFFHFALGSTLLLFIVNIYIIFGEDQITKHILPKKADISLKLPGQEEKSLSFFDLLSKKGQQALSLETLETPGHEKPSTAAELKNTFSHLIRKIKVKARELALSTSSGNVYKEFSNSIKAVAHNIKSATKKSSGAKSPSYAKVTLPLGQGRLNVGTTRTAQAPALQNLQQQTMHQAIVPLTPNVPVNHGLLTPVQIAHIGQNRAVRQPLNWTQGTAPIAIQMTFGAHQAQTPQRQAFFQYFAPSMPIAMNYHNVGARMQSASISNNLGHRGTLISIQSLNFAPQTLTLSSNQVYSSYGTGHVMTGNARVPVSSDPTTRSLLASPRVPLLPFQMRAAAEGGKKLPFERDDRDPPPMGGVVSGSRSSQQVISNDFDDPRLLPNPSLKIPNPFVLVRQQKAEIAEPQETEVLKTQPKEKFTAFSNVKLPARVGINSDVSTQQPLDYPDIPNLADLFDNQSVSEVTPQEGEPVQVRATAEAATVTQNAVPLRTTVVSDVETPHLLEQPSVKFGPLALRKANSSQQHHINTSSGSVSDPQEPSSLLGMTPFLKGLLKLFQNTHGRTNTKDFGKVLRVHAKAKGSNDAKANFDRLFAPVGNTYELAPSQRALSFAFNNYMKIFQPTLSEGPYPPHLLQGHFNLTNLLSLLSSSTVKDAADRVLDSMGFGKIIRIHERGNRVDLEVASQEKDVETSPSRFITITDSFLKAFLPRFLDSLGLNPLTPLSFSTHALGSLLKIVKKEIGRNPNDTSQVGKILAIHQRGKVTKTPNEEQHAATVEKMSDVEASKIEQTQPQLVSYSADQEDVETQPRQGTRVDMKSFDEASERVKNSLQELTLVATRAKNNDDILLAVQKTHLALSHLTGVGGQIKKENSNDQKVTKKIDSIIKELTIKTNKSIYGSLRGKLPAETIRGLLATKQKRPVRDLQDLFENPVSEAQAKTSPKPIEKQSEMTRIPSEEEITKFLTPIINGLSQTVGKWAFKPQKRSTVYQFKTGRDVTEHPIKNSKFKTLPMNFRLPCRPVAFDCFGPECAFVGAN